MYLRITLILSGVIFFWGYSFATEGMSLPVEFQLPILLKILTYDRNFEKKVGDELVIGIVYNSQDDDSKKVKQKVSDVLDSLSEKTVKNIPLNYTDLDYNSKGSLESSIQSKKIDVLYIASGCNWYLKSILQISQKYKILTMSGITDYVRKGVSVGIGTKEKKPEIWINLESAKAEGSDFGAKLLKLCKVIKR